jgi:DNA-binding GntR family transcriptional regulator
LRSDIVAGALPPGQPLRQEELAERFGVSRLPVRDALLRLEAEGLVDVDPSRGAFVASLSAAEAREIHDLRVLLEGDAIARAVPVMTSADLTRVELAHLASVRAGDGPEWSARDREFHLALYEPGNRPRQLALIENLRVTLDRCQRAHAALPCHTTEWLRDHEALVAACRAGDASGARRLLVGHLERAAALVVADLQDR